jgi:AbrB family looped-hinge helix DNA binding protein
MSKVTAKYQITIPPEVRRELGIKPGQDLEIARIDGQYVLIFNRVSELKRRWQGKFKSGETTDQYLTKVRGEVS